MDQAKNSALARFNGHFSRYFFTHKWVFKFFVCGLRGNKNVGQAFLIPAETTKVKNFNTLFFGFFERFMKR